jgi:glycosyltransferase involved in cell wall biosynthesis
MKTVLILTYYWPPAGGPGVQRWLKFVKFFKSLEWNPIILTVKDGTYSAMDEALTREIPENLAIYKTRSKDPFRFYKLLKGKKDNAVSVALINIDKEKSLIDSLSMYIRSNFFIPDARKGWTPYAYKKAVDIIHKQNIDLVVTTGPPHSTHLAGLKLKRKLKVKWLADLRDPWTTVYYNDMLPRTARTRKRDKKLEDAVLKNADAVTVVSPGMKSEFEDRNPNVHVVMNGFDLEDMNAVAGNSSNKRFCLTYTGNFKPNQHVPQIWNAIFELLEENEQFRQDFQLRFVGNLDASVPDYFNANGFRDHLEIIGYVPHYKVIEEMSTSDLLLFVVPQSRNNHLIITGKLFEYLASGTPLLSVGPPDGDASKIIHETGRQEMINYNDKEVFKKSLLAYYERWKNSKGKLEKLDADMLDQYTRKSSAKKMSIIMNKTIQ